MPIRYASFRLVLALPALFLMNCAGDIKGEPGPPGISLNANKPAYEQLDSDTTQVIIPASDVKPAIVGIAGGTYTNTTNVVCDLATSGRNGLDTGSIQGGKMYYLYAIPAESGDEFDSVASLSDPTVGPNGYDERSYLGAFRVATDETVSEFRHTGHGIIYLGSKKILEDTTVLSSWTILDPNTGSASFGIGDVLPVTAVTAVLNGSASVSANAGPATIGRGDFRVSTDSNATTTFLYGWDAIPDGGSMRVSGTAETPLNDQGKFYIEMGYIDPSETGVTFALYVMGFTENAQLWP
jgi:hypothetical protein